MNDKVASIQTVRAKRPQPMQGESFSTFHGKEVPKTDWLIPGVLVKGGVTLFSGQGGKGKSLLCMQMQAALALGLDWIGMPVKEKLGSFALYCEDERDVLHARMEEIRVHYNCSYADLEIARFISRVGFNNELMRFWGKKEEGEPTQLLGQLREELTLWDCRILIVDTVADAFGGNENFRSQVRTFVGALRRLVLPIGGGVILNAHPSRAGISDGSGLSGSTAWEASVRTRINLTEPKKEDKDAEGEQEPTNDRVLKVMKSNYGASGTKWKLEWKNGVFVRTDMVRPGSTTEKIEAKAALLAAARWLVDHGSFLAAEQKTKSSLTVRAKKDMPSCKDIPFGHLTAAQDALEEEGKLVIVEMGPASKRRRYIRPFDTLYPGEKAAEPQTGDLLAEGKPL